ncbi:carboxymuconolactone decarboxylase family protein [Burkholderiaceae bacterium DAT-1]|nr:carboxymuconolactone decarboxylase family protein [Burkholderiaceae bacterium DAT-1]
MTPARLPYADLAPAIFRGLKQAKTALAEGVLPTSLLELVYLRVSQMNGCEFCMRMHSEAARRAGISQSKLDVLPGWQISSHFDAREHAALAWCESVTHLAVIHVPDCDYLPLRELFSDQEIAELTLAIATMNALNRVAVAMRQ